MVADCVALGAGEGRGVVGDVAGVVSCFCCYLFLGCRELTYVAIVIFGLSMRRVRGRSSGGKTGGVGYGKTGRVSIWCGNGVLIAGHTVLAEGLGISVSDTR